MYVNGLLVAAKAAKADADSKWNWTTGLPNSSSWNDAGGENWEGECTEAYAEFFAFMSLVDPDPNARPQWAMRARALLMYVINQAALGQSLTAPFRTPGFVTGNRANYWGEAWGLTVDWIYSSLSSADKTTIRKVFLRWLNEIYTVPNRAGQTPLYPGTVNDPRVLGQDPTQSAFTLQNNQTQLRWSVNNYFLGQTRTLSLMAMAFDPADDPPVDSAQPASAVGNSVRSYVGNALGWWLYQAYATFEDAPTVRKALGLTGANISLGVAAGGLPVEGSLYGESLGFLAQTLLGLRTAGYNDPATYGPQAGFLEDAYWNNAVDGFLHQTAPTPFVAPSQSWLGPIYPVATYGDTLRTWVEPGVIDLIAPIGLHDESANNAARLAKTRWIAQNILEGGPANVFKRAGSNIWGNSYASQAIFYFMLFDPAASPVADPRPSVPTTFVAPAIGSVLSRTDWSGSATWFSYRCSWETINHISGDCGQFTLWRKGAWLTKEWSNYALDWMGYTPLYHNTLALQNAPATISPSIWDTTLKWGGQWNNGGYDGDPSTLISANDNWSYALSDATNLYNHPDWWTASRNALDILHASRSIAWLNKNHIVIYDRATSGATGRFKRFNLVTQATASIVQNTATATANGQTLTVQSLLPATASLRTEHFWKTAPAQEVNQTSELDTSYDRLIIEDLSLPADVRFLTVLQGTDSGVSADKATRVSSIAGTAYDGAYIGDSIVMFPQSLASPVSTTTYQTPSSVTRHLITGLTPGVGYDIVMTTTGGVTTVILTKGSTYTADVGGVIGVGFPPSQLPTQGGVVIGQQLVGPSGSPSPSPTPNPTPKPSNSCGTVTKQSATTYLGWCAPLALIANGVYLYDMTGQRTYWQQNGVWDLINDGGPKKGYMKTSFGWQGTGAPEQLIAKGAVYYDTVEKRYYLQTGSTWTLTLGSAPSASGAK
jgi:hypothetical protein